MVINCIISEHDFSGFLGVRFSFFVKVKANRPLLLISYNNNKMNDYYYDDDDGLKNTPFKYHPQSSQKSWAPRFK